MAEIEELSKEQLIKDVGAITHGYTGADLSSLIKESAMKALRRVSSEIDLKNN